MTIFERIEEKLKSADCPFVHLEHDPMGKSEEVARLRGVALETGAKAIVVVGNKSKAHWLFVLPANLKLDAGKVKSLVGESVSFAADVEAVTGCVPGAVPPFGSVVGLKTFMDPRLSENIEINFNAGSLTDSIRMKCADYVRIEQPEIVEIAKAA